MQTGNNDQSTGQPNENKPGTGNRPLITDDKVGEALKQAEHDIEEDPDFRTPDLHMIWTREKLRGLKVEMSQPKNPDYFFAVLLL